jgi:maltose alpha-D-glucosyltransferase/alpha-amylase
VESNVWKFDPIARLFYFHTFYSFQPDLNMGNKEVQEEVFNIMKFWLSLGVSGFRVDAAKLVFDRKGKRGTEIKNADEFIKNLHRFIKSINPEGVLLAEADVTADKVGFFFGKGNRIYMLLNFLLNRYLFLGLANKTAEPIVRELERLPKPSKDGIWVNFLRNLYELNIDLLTPQEKKVIFEQFGKESWMRIYDRGIRRRLATMMEGDLKRLKMCYSLLFSLPGAPLIVYGDEIGMGDLLDLPEREAVRIPMQWNSKLNGGFSEIPTLGLFRAALSIGPFRYERLNVASELKKKDSLLAHVKKIIRLRKNLPEIGAGTYNVLDPKNNRVFVIAHTYMGKQSVIFHNLSDGKQNADVEALKGLKLKEIFSDSKYPKLNGSFQINGYGYRWFKVED